jgi:hypothetical protein
VTRLIPFIAWALLGAVLAVIWWETLPGACRYAASMAPQEPPISRMTGLGQ